MTVVHTYLYTVVDKQPGCHALKMSLLMFLVSRILISVYSLTYDDLKSF